MEDLTDLLLEDWKCLGSVRELGQDSLRFIRMEMERSWGSDKLGVFDEKEAQKWVLGVSKLLTPSIKSLSLNTNFKPIL